MNWVLSAKQMQAVDHRTIEEMGLPSRLLMENAGKACAELILERFSALMFGKIAVLCGYGNNGGDGLVIARYLNNRGYEPQVVMVGQGHQTEDNRINYDLCKYLDIEIIEHQSPEQSWEPGGYSLIIDAIFGIGFKGEPDKLHQDLFHKINRSDAFVISIDIPSGMPADGGDSPSCVVSDACIAIEAYKYAHMTNRIADLSLVRIGIPVFYITEHNPAVLIERDNHQYPVRHWDAHKGSYGRVVIIAGSPGLSGAAILCTRSALKSGAGYVYLFHHPDLADIYGQISPEVLISAYDPQDGYARLAEAIKQASSVLIGPGLGKSAQALEVLRYVLENCRKPMVIDADALNLLADNPELMEQLADRELVLTPHWGEFCRLAGISLQELKTDPINYLQTFSTENKLAVLLKSHYTVFCDSTVVAFNLNGNDGLATGGSGDVLAGIIASFEAQGMPLGQAAINASYLLGDTAQALAMRMDTAAITPTDIVEHLFVSPIEHD